MDKHVNLNVKCIKCGKSLMDHQKMINNMPSIALNISHKDKTGKIWLCSNYGCYQHEKNIEVPDKEIVNFYCPHCEELLNSNINCKSCEAPIVKFNIDIGGIVSICSRKGCNNHYVMFEDLSTAISKFHRAYGM